MTSHQHGDRVQLQKAPPGHFLYGNMAEFMVGRLSFLGHMVRDHGDFVRYRLGCDVTTLINDADFVTTLFADWEHVDNAMTNGWLYLNQSYLAVHGRARAKPRSLLHSAVCPRALFGQCEPMAHAVLGVLGRFSAGETRNVLDDMLQASFEMISQAVFGRDATTWLEPVRRYLTDVQVLGGAYSESADVMRRLELTQRRTVFETLERTVEELVAACPADPDESVPSLATLLRARQEGAMTDRNLVHELCVLLLSNATPAVTTASTFYLLSHHPEARERLEREIEEAFSGALPGVEELMGLRYLDQVVKEAMRLFPPVGLIPRQVVKDFEYRGLELQAGTQVHVSPYLLHRHARYWDDPHAFRPERFDTELPDHRPVTKGAYIPFGAGIRRCIGDQLALLEIKLMVALTLQRFRLHVEPGFVPNYDVSPFGANFPQSVSMPMVVEPREPRSTGRAGQLGKSAAQVST
jgi:cytochrome P450